MRIKGHDDIQLQRMVWNKPALVFLIGLHVVRYGLLSLNDRNCDALRVILFWLVSKSMHAIKLGRLNWCYPCFKRERFG